MIDFLKYRYICALFSVVVFATFIGTYVYKRSTRGYAFNYSVDFTGGSQILLKFASDVSDAQLKDILENKGWNNPVIRKFSQTETAVRLPVSEDETTDVKDLGEKVQEVITAALPESKPEVLAVDSVSGGLGAALRWQSLRAVLIALILMLLYIGWRFWSLSFGAGAVVALFHDAIVILTVFLLLDKEISINVIGAILAVLGYSVNDTIVIFAQIRDALKKSSKAISIEQIVNQSLNQTLRRTVLTSVSTALVVLSLIALGGETLRDLSLALLVGIIFGTYSSIYIASPVMLMLYKEKR